MSVRATAHGFTYHDLATADMEEVAAHFHLHGGLRGGKRSGVAFARKLAQSDVSSKNLVRQRLIELYTLDKWPRGLRILTMPGLTWNFEYQLLRARGYFHADICSARTRIICVENDELVYRASLDGIPGKRLKIIGPRAVQTSLIPRYYAMDVEDYIVDPNIGFFDAAWLDFTGCLTERRLEAIRHFWKTVGLHLTVTSLKARWPERFGRLLRKHNGLTSLLLETCKDSALLDEYEYFDGVPMHQVTLTKPGKKRRYLGYEPYPERAVQRLLRGGMR